MKFKAVKNNNYIDGKPRYLVKEIQTKSIIVLNCGTELLFRNKDIAQKVAELLNENYKEKLCGK